VAAISINRMEHVEKSIADFLDKNYEARRASVAASLPVTNMPAVSEWRRGYGRNFAELVTGYVDCLKEEELDYRNDIYLYDVEVTMIIPHVRLDLDGLKRAAQRYARALSDVLTRNTPSVRGITAGDATGIHNVRLQSVEAPPVIGKDQTGENVTLGFQITANLTVELQTDAIAYSL